jgi:phage terminase large subunit
LRGSSLSESLLKIECVDKLGVLLQKKKRFKILVGGRASTKTIFVSDVVLSDLMRAKRWCCAREFQASIDDSVHQTLTDEIKRLDMTGFEVKKTEIVHSSGGSNFYKGLSRNITSLKGINCHGLWIEEGEGLTSQTLKVLTASIRITPLEAKEARMRGEIVEAPEIWITMNRGSRSDPVSKKFLARAETELARCGYYEDDLMIVIEINYPDNPWFLESGLEVERLDDRDKMSIAEYESKWLGKYYDEVEGSIIKPEWFDACIDAHKLPHLQNVFRDEGATVAAHDLSGTGGDSKGFASRTGSIVKRVVESYVGEVDEGVDWAIALAKSEGADCFVWDGDGMGAGSKSQIDKAFKGTKTKYHMFKGSLSGRGQDDAMIEFRPAKGDNEAVYYYQQFKNNRAQFYIDKLARRIYNTYRCVVRGEYIDPDDMLSIDSDGVDDMDALRSQVCRVPRVKNNNGLEQIMAKADMKKNGIESPGGADSLMMCLYAYSTVNDDFEMNYKSLW